MPIKYDTCTFARIMASIRKQIIIKVKKKKCILLFKPNYKLWKTISEKLNNSVKKKKKNIGFILFKNLRFSTLPVND